MTGSFLRLIDQGVRALAYNRFKGALDMHDENEDSVIFPKEVAMRHIAEKRGRTTVEFVNVWREVTKFDWNRQRTAVARQGINMPNAADPLRSQLVNVKSIPAQLEYSAWWWTKEYDKYNLCSETYMFWQQTTPKLFLNYTVGSNTYPLQLDLHFGEIVDESTTPEMFEKGLYFVGHAPIIVDGWIFNSDELVRTVKKITITISDSSSDPLNPVPLWQEELVCT